MSGSHSGMLKSSGGLAAAIFSSRLLGFAREVLTARIIGGGTLMTAWSLAFLLPNLFRRILGEGALGTALVPMISHSLELEGHEAARRKFSTILIWLSFLLAAITVAVSVPAYAASFFIETERVRLAFKLTPVVMPYCVFICLIGVATSLLNSLRVFFLPALASLLLNALLVACLLFVCPWLKGSPTLLLDALGISVLLSGALELIVMAWLLKRSDMLPAFGKSVFFDWKAIGEIWRLALPGLIGASALQISLVVDRSIACWISEYAVPALNYSDRLIYLPIGVFAVSFGTVSLAEMSLCAARKDYSTMLSHMAFSLRNLLFITFPMAAFMAALSVPIIRLVYFGGEFGERELAETSYAFMFYAYGIPAFAAVKISVSGFYARKDMRTPVIVSISCIALDIVLCLCLMLPLKQGGIALATVLCSYLNNILLLVLLQRSLGGVPWQGILRHAVALALASGAAAFPALWTYSALAKLLPRLWSVPQDLLPLAGASIVFGALFLGIAFALRMQEANFVVKKLLRLK